MNRRSSQQTNRCDINGKLPQRPSRLVQRDLPYHQSRNALNIHLKGLTKYAGKLRQHDWFHVWLRQNTAKSCVVLLLAWTIAILVFAALYMAVDYGYQGTVCSLLRPGDLRSTMNYGGYFAFSLETTTTVGYGLPNGVNSFFEECAGLQITMYLQMVWSMMFNAFLFAFFFSRLAKSENRAAQVIFSKTAVLTRPPANSRKPYNPWTFTVRVTDVDAAYPVVEAHVRLYAKIDSELVEMRILAPNDILGGRLFLSWPTTVVHEIDSHSPLHPLTTLPKTHVTELHHGGLNKRHAEAVAGDHDRYACPACGESYGSLDRLRRHVRYVQRYETNDKLPIGPQTHRAIDVETLKPPPEPTLKELKEWFPEEVIVVMEGIDSLASGTFMALQSYTLDDVVFEGQFADCMKFSKTETVVDLHKFHSVVGVASHVENRGDWMDSQELNNTANFRQDRHSRRHLMTFEHPATDAPRSVARHIIPELSDVNEEPCVGASLNEADDKETSDGANGALPEYKADISEEPPQDPDSELSNVNEEPRVGASLEEADDKETPDGANGAVLEDKAVTSEEPPHDPDSAPPNGTDPQ